MGALTTHVLDTSAGRPAAGVRVELFRDHRDGEPVAAGETNADGRCAAPLLQGAALRSGEYELVFHAGEYFRANGIAVTDPPFLDRVVIRFGVADPSGHYHVPLLLSPYGYSTYRGS
jgi:5-hydroxyisourate hydrolase